MLTSKPPNIVIAATIIIATKAEGIFSVSFGSPHMISIVRVTKPSIIFNEDPVIHSIVPFMFSLNNPSWAKNITMANPLTNPIITGWGISLTNLPNRNTPANICIPPTISKVMNSH